MDEEYWNWIHFPQDEAPVATCPFADPQFVMPVDEPCPVCGMRGFDWPDIDNGCVG